MRVLLPLVMGFVLSVAISGCMGGTKGSTSVSAKDNQFDPNSLSLKQNDMINVKNTGANLHSVTVHKVGDTVTTTKRDTDIQPNASTEYKFEETGTFHVYCKYHTPPGQFSTGMVLTVTVS